MTFYQLSLCSQRLKLWKFIISQMIFAKNLQKSWKWNFEVTKNSIKYRNNLNCMNEAKIIFYDFFHSELYRCFNHFYQKYVCKHLTFYFLCIVINNHFWTGEGNRKNEWESAFSFMLVHSLLRKNYKVEASTTERIVSYEGDVKLTEFKFVRFREYKML